ILKLAPAPAADQLVQHRAQGVNVSGCGDRSAQRLLRTGVIGRQDSKEGLRLLRSLLIEELGYAEVQKLWSSVLGHQDVGGLQIAVDHQVAMGVLDCLARRPE